VPISPQEQVIARSAIRRATFSAASSRIPNPPARQIQRAKARCLNITPSSDGIGDWSEEDIAYLLETGNTSDFDVIGESMVPVQENMAKITPEDRNAIAAYIKSLPARPDAMPKSKEKAGRTRGQVGPVGREGAPNSHTVDDWAHSEPSLCSRREVDASMGQARVMRSRRSVEGSHGGEIGKR